MIWSDMATWRLHEGGIPLVYLLDVELLEDRS